MGIKFLSVVGAAYDRARLSEAEAQAVNDAPGLADLVERFITKARSGFFPPEGGRVHIVLVPVQLDRDWQEAVNAAGPYTPGDYDVRKVDDQYPPTRGAPPKEVEIVLVNLGLMGDSWDSVTAWAKRHKLNPAGPRHVFAIGEHKPRLNEELGSNYMYVVATEECAFDGDRRACCVVWWDGSKRECDLHWVVDYNYSGGWFAFIRE